MRKMAGMQERLPRHAIVCFYSVQMTADILDWLQACERQQSTCLTSKRCTCSFAGINYYPSVAADAKNLPPRLHAHADMVGEDVSISSLLGTCPSASLAAGNSQLGGDLHLSLALSGNGCRMHIVLLSLACCIAFTLGVYSFQETQCMCRD